MSSYLITGAARGLGLEISTLLASKPSSEVSLVIATARRESPALRTLAQESHGRVVIISAELTDENMIQEAADKVRCIVGDKGLDVLINNAGIMNRTPGGIERMYVYLPFVLGSLYILINCRDSKLTASIG